MKKYTLSVNDIMEQFNVCDKTVRNWIKDRGMPHIKLGSTIRFNSEEVEKWIDEQNEKK